MSELRDFDIKHWENIRSYLRRTQRSFFVSADRVSRIYEVLPDQPFDLGAMANIKKAIELELRRLAKDIHGNIVNGINNEWTLANAKNDELLKGLLSGRTLPKVLEAKWMGRNLDALQAFSRRTEGGMGLSDRVWKTVNGHAANIERHMALGVYERTPARKLASEMKQYLNEPDRLFRRVRDAEGNLRLSAAARDYHPGAGRYRSAYKNALRMTRTETNRSYQQADNERWKQQDFVLGIEVRRSNVPYDCDICDAGAGEYPKDYEWDLWHPNCRCVAVPILPDLDDFGKSLEAGMEGKDYDFDGYIKDIPDSMTNFKSDTGFKHFGHD